MSMKNQYSINNEIEPQEEDSVNDNSNKNNEGYSSRGNKWSKDEDKLLLDLTEKYEEKNWEDIATHFEGKSPKQCFNRWKKINTQTELIKGPWTYEEDRKLLKWIQLEGPKKWSMCAETIPGRTGKQCRERWFNALNPQVKKGEWTIEEDYKIYLLYSQYGGKWSKIALNFPNRTENSIKNRFYSSLRKLYSEKIKNIYNGNSPQVRSEDEVSCSNAGARLSVGIGELIKLFPAAIDSMSEKLMKYKKMSLPQFVEYERNLIEQSNKITKEQKKFGKKNIKFELSGHSGHTRKKSISHKPEKEKVYQEECEKEINLECNQEIKREFEFEEKENTISESKSDADLLDIEREINSVCGGFQNNQGKESMDFFDFNAKQENPFLLFSDPKNSNNALNSESNIPQNNQNNNIPQTGNNNITNSSSSNRVKNYLNINCNIFLPKKDNNLQNSNPKGGYTNHKADIYYYLLEELEDLEALIKSAKNELLTYNNNAKCV